VVVAVAGVLASDLVVAELAVVVVAVVEVEAAVPSSPRWWRWSAAVALVVAEHAPLDRDVLAELVAIALVAAVELVAGGHVPPGVAWVLSGAPRPRVRNGATIRQLLGFRQGYQ
jgi:hypothetical protein